MSIRDFFRRLREDKPTQNPANRPYLEIRHTAPEEWAWRLFDPEVDPHHPIDWDIAHSAAAAEGAGKSRLARHVAKKNFVPSSYTIGKDHR